MAALKIGADMMQAASGGYRKALAQLLAIAQPDIRRFAQRTCRSSSDVDDAVQEALWLLTRRVGTLRSVRMPICGSTFQQPFNRCPNTIAP
jgi:DNA-directed RNA polymerase specialized sigma24 family protein